MLYLLLCSDEGLFFAVMTIFPFASSSSGNSRIILKSRTKGLYLCMIFSTISISSFKCVLSLLEALVGMVKLLNLWELSRAGS